MAMRNAEAKIILARADVESAKLMREAADILATDAAMQIRYLDHVSKLATSANTKVVFFPSNFNAGAAMSELANSQAVEKLVG